MLLAFMTDKRATVHGNGTVTDYFDDGSGDSLADKGSGKVDEVANVLLSRTHTLAGQALGVRGSHAVTQAAVVGKGMGVCSTAEAGGRAVALSDGTPAIRTALHGMVVDAAITAVLAAAAVVRLQQHRHGTVQQERRHEAT